MKIPAPVLHQIIREEIAAALNQVGAEASRADFQETSDVGGVALDRIRQTAEAAARMVRRHAATCAVRDHSTYTVNPCDCGGAGR